MRDLKCSEFPSFTSLNQWTTTTRRVSGRHRTKWISYPITPEQLKLEPLGCRHMVNVWLSGCYLATDFLLWMLNNKLTLLRRKLDSITHGISWLLNEDFTGFSLLRCYWMQCWFGNRNYLFPFCLWTWIFAFGRNPSLLQMMKTSLHACIENSANMDAIRKS